LAGANRRARAAIRKSAIPHDRSLVATSPAEGKCWF
jgi:hypothetical protein